MLYDRDGVFRKMLVCILHCVRRLNIHTVKDFHELHSCVANSPVYGQNDQNLLSTLLFVFENKISESFQIISNQLLRKL